MCIRDSREPSGRGSPPPKPRPRSSRAPIPHLSLIHIYRSGTLLGATTTTWTGSFLENILTHRRIELWGEYGRLFDVRRLGQGIDRRTDDGFSEECISMMNRRNVNITKACLLYTSRCV